MDVEFPEVFQDLFRPARYKVYYGGRGGAKSWAMARAALAQGVERTLRVLCVREFQNSIEDSVHKLLSDQIVSMGLEDFYKIEKRAITGANGTTFSFEGVRNNAQRVKSYEGIDICWAEEAALLTKNSWDVLVPTIRKPGSEIWVSFNPEDQDDETYRRFVRGKPSNAIVKKVTWRDNPYFPEVLRQEMEDCRRDNYDDYLWIWEGNCRVVLDGSVYKDEIRSVLAEGRLGAVPYMRGIGTHVTLDLGSDNYTAMWFRQNVGLERHYIDFYQNRMKDVDHYVQVVKNRGYSIASITLPHDAKAIRLGAKNSIERQIRDAFPAIRVTVLPKYRIHEGLNAARKVFPRSWFDVDRCSDGWSALTKYKYELIQGTTRFSSTPNHDEFSDAADAFRYDALSNPGDGFDNGAAEGSAEGTPGLFARAGAALKLGQNGWLGK
jgi:phage terminase large subunit